MKTPRPDELTQFIEAAAFLLDLPIEPAWKDAVKGHLEAALRLAASFAEFALLDETEPASVFVA